MIFKQKSPKSPSNNKKQKVRNACINNKVQQHNRFGNIVANDFMERIKERYARISNKMLLLIEYQILSIRIFFITSNTFM